MPQVFPYPLKTSENLWFSDILRGYRKTIGMEWVNTVKTLHDSCMTSEKVTSADVFMGYRERSLA